MSDNPKYRVLYKIGKSDITSKDCHKKCIRQTKRSSVTWFAAYTGMYGMYRSRLQYKILHS